MKQKVLVIILMAALAVILVSCTESSPSPSTSAATKSPAPPVSTTTAAPPAQPSSTGAPPKTTQAPKPSAVPTTATAPVENKKYGGDLSIIYLSEIMSFDAPVNSAGPIDSILQPPIWENLISYDKDNNKIPVLARDFDVSADGKTITFNLREGIKFQDGTDFNAEAVKYNIDNFKFLRQSFFGNIESVDAIDTYTVRFNLSQPDNQLLSALGQLWGTMNSPTAAKAEIEAGGNQPKIGVIGTGPFKFVDWTRGSSLKVEKWDGYWETGEPYLDSITYLEFSNAQTGVMSFQAGKAQIISGLVPRDAATLKQQGYTIHHCPAYMYALWPSSKNSDSPWSNTDVRLAAEYAIDKAAIVKTYGYGFCEAQYEIALPDKSSYVPGLEPRLYDPDKAKQLLADAGYANGFETTIHALTTEDDDILTAIQGYLSEVGIQANINKVPVPVFMDMGMASTGWEGLRYWYPGTDLEPVATYTAFYWHAPVHTGSMDKPQEMLDAITEAVTSTDRAVVDKALQKVTAIQYDKALTIPLWTWPGISALDDSVNDCAISTIDLHKTWSASSIWLGE